MSKKTKGQSAKTELAELETAHKERREKLLTNIRNENKSAHNMPRIGVEPVDSELGGVDPAEWFKPDKPHAGMDESKLLDAVKAIFSTDNMAVKTVLEEKHMVALVRGFIFADKYNCKTMRLLCQGLMEVRVSHKGRGRKDLIATLRAAIHDTDSTDHESGNMRQRLFGG